MPDYTFFRLERLPGRLFALNLAAVAALALAHAAAVTARFGFGVTDLGSIYLLFDLSGERSVGTWFAVITLLLTASLLALIAVLKRRSDEWSGHWALLALVFLGLSIDEQVSLHERLELAISRGWDASGILGYLWAAPAVLFIAAIAAGYLPFLRALPPRTAYLFLLAGSLYVAGALLAEIPEAWLIDRYGGESAEVAWQNLMQDPLEMLGLAIFTYVLLRHLVTDMRLRRVSLGRQPPGGAAAPGFGGEKPR